MDGGWKQIIEDFIEEFFRFYFPKIHAMIDFEAEIQFLDKELTPKSWSTPRPANAKRTNSSK